MKWNEKSRYDLLEKLNLFTIFFLNTNQPKRVVFKEYIFVKNCIYFNILMIILNIRFTRYYITVSQRFINISTTRSQIITKRKLLKANCANIDISVKQNLNHNFCEWLRNIPFIYIYVYGFGVSTLLQFFEGDFWKPWICTSNMFCKDLNKHYIYLVLN